MKKKKPYWKRLWVDMEWGKKDSKVYLVGVIYSDPKSKRDKYIWFKTVEEFLDWVKQNKQWKRIKLMSHWGMKAEFKFIIKEVGVFYADEENMFMTVILPDTKQEIKLVDTVRLFRGSIKQIGKLLGMEKLDNEILVDYADEIDYNSIQFQKILEYNKRDIEIMKNCFKLLSKAGVKRIKDTIASTSFSYFFNPVKVKRFSPEDMPMVYRGGIVEVFKLYDRNIKVYDVNSLYPTVMSEWIANPYQKPRRISYYDEDMAGIYKVIVRDYHLPYSFLTYKYEGVNRYVDVNEGEFNLSTEEVKYLIDKGVDVEVLYGYVVDKSYFLRDKLKDMYRKRKENPVFNVVMKLLMNSSYGKFGERDYDTRVIKILDRPELHELLKDVTGFDVKLINGVWYIKQRVKGITRHRNLLVASNITGSARVKLFRYFDKVNPKKILYCDTDSIHTTSSVLDDYVGNELGQLKIEYKVKEGIYLARKSYIFYDEEYRNKQKEEFEDLLDSEREYLIKHGVEPQPLKVKIKGLSISRNLKDVLKGYSVFTIDDYEKIKEELITNKQVRIRKSFLKLPTVLEFVRENVIDKKRVEKEMVFQPNKYRIFEDIISRPYLVEVVRNG